MTQTIQLITYLFTSEKAALHEFTSSDWDGWSGAERFEDGSEPLFGYNGDAMFIADNAGVHVYFDSDVINDEMRFEFECSGDLAKIVALGLVHKPDLGWSDFLTMPEFVRV